MYICTRTVKHHLCFYEHQHLVLIRGPWGVVTESKKRDKVTKKEEKNLFAFFLSETAVQIVLS